MHAASTKGAVCCRGVGSVCGVCRVRCFLQVTEAHSNKKLQQLAGER